MGWPPPSASVTAIAAPNAPEPGRPVWSWIAFVVSVAIAVPIILYTVARGVFGAIGCSVDPGGCPRAEWAFVIAMAFASVLAPAVAIGVISRARPTAVNAVWTLAMFVPAALWWLAVT